MIRPISRCFNSQLLDICQQAKQVAELSGKVKDNLASPLRDNCQVASFHKGCLLITTDNAVWATELRYSVPDLRDRLRKAGLYQLSTIKIAVIDPINQNEPGKPRKGHTLSSAARESIRNASELCTYPPLKTVLCRLARGKKS